MTRPCRLQKAAALVEFALAWPIVLLAVLGTVETAVWAAEAYAARSSALAGAEAGSVSGGTAALASAVALRALAGSLVGVRPAAWCPGSPSPPLVWVCALDLGAAMEVDVGGSAPALVPLLTGAGLPLHAHVTLQKEAYAL
jgi:hypothetical protein